MKHYFSIRYNFTLIVNAKVDSSHNLVNGRINTFQRRIWLHFRFLSSFIIKVKRCYNNNGTIGYFRVALLDVHSMYLMTIDTKCCGWVMVTYRPVINVAMTKTTATCNFVITPFVSNMVDLWKILNIVKNSTNL